MTRRLLAIASALSLVLCAATCILWAQSYFGAIALRAVHDFYQHEGLVQIRFVVQSFRGGVTLEFVHHHAMTPESAGDLLQDHQWHRSIEAWSDSAALIDASQESYLPQRTYRFSPTKPSPLGFQIGHNRRVYQGNHYWRFIASIPYWPWPIAFAICPSSRFWRRRRTRLRASHLQCVSCGYDLRASKHRCPECGTAIPSKVTA